MYFVLLLVSFCASAVGAVCGIGGGVIIKPLLDALGVAGVSTISFLSGCTVLSMSCYSVGKAMLAGERDIEGRPGTPLALGAAVGGVAGKALFSLLRSMAAQPERVGGYQSICLALVTLATLLYTVFQSGIKTRRVESRAACAVIGLLLGVMSSFLGIGGGPINLVVLYYFFSMSTKTAARNSLYIIFVSQAASLLTTLFTHSVPAFEPLWLVVMAGGGILGGVAGRALNRKLSEGQVALLFQCLILTIIGVSCYNAVRYLI